MSAVPSRATGTYGWDAVELIEERSGRPLWWGQVLVIVRALEHDAAGELVHRKVCLTEPRQQGKSTVIGEVASWRLQSGDQFGETQEILHIARDVGAAVNVQRPFRLRAERDESVQGSGRRWPAGDRVPAGWEPLADPLVRVGVLVQLDDGDRRRGVGSCPRRRSIDGVAPTLLQRRSSQLWLVSTASHKSTPLMLGAERRRWPPSMLPARRCGSNGVVRLMPMSVIPWSGDWTCPRWTPEIAVRYADLYASALSRRSSDPVADDPVEAFACQYLNQWPPSVEAAQARGEPLVDLGAWHAVDIDVLFDAPLVIVVEDNYGTGAALAVAGRGQSDPRVHIETELYATRARGAGASSQTEGRLRMLTGARRRLPGP